MTNHRKLGARTVLPDDLYVTREADRQLSEIVREMGRPGYVLVARQMGKTNLLLNMKRRREELGDIVIYVDLSQRFKTARACFRYIIDLAIDTNPDLFSGLENEITDERSFKSLDPSLEYTRHLRKLLQCVRERKLIVVLDEIDSLVNAAYSDSILAHVRSTYFVRTNYSEFERLTYVLSGVAEPSDLIKDKNISPFNIGEKIYLDDFSNAEFDEFVDKSQIKISDATKQRIFYWAHGNPRITWDICSSVEEALNAQQRIGPAEIDEIVSRLYLTAFDRPPVDHIRVLVEGDASLRAALMALKYGKAATLDDRAKAKLYLAGIVGDSGNSPELRNPIIEAALSESWLKQFEASSADPIATASEHYVGRRFQLAVDLFQRAISNGKALSPTQFVTYGLSLYGLGQYERATETLAPVIDKVRGETRTSAEYHLGSSYLLSDRPNEAIVVLHKAAAGTGPYRFPSEILLAAANYRVGHAGDENLRVQSKQRILEAAKEESVGGELGDATVVPSLIYSVGFAAIAAGNHDDAIEYLECSNALAPPGLIPGILITRFAIESDKDTRRSLAAKAADTIIENQLHPVNSLSSHAAYTERGFISVISALIDSDQADKAHELFTFAMANEKIEIPAARYIHDLISNYREGQVLSAERIDKMVIAAVGADQLASATPWRERLAMIFSSNADKIDTVLSYLQIPTEKRVALLTDLDISHIVAALNDALAKQENDTVIELVEKANSSLAHDVNPAWIMFLAYCGMAAQNALKLYSKARDTAIQIVALQDRVVDEEESVQQFIGNIVAQARRVLARGDVTEPNEYRHIGRNQKVIVRDASTNELSTVKFKLIEHRLRSHDVVLEQVLPR